MKVTSIVFSALFFLLLAQLSSPNTFSRNFVDDYQTSAGSVYISTDLGINPTMGPSGQTFCVGQTYTPSVAMSGTYVVNSAYDGQVGSAVLNNPNTYPLCLRASSQLNPNSPINFVTSTNLGLLQSNANIYADVGVFDNFVSGMNHAQNYQRSRYYKPGGGYYTVNSNSNFEAIVGMFCKGSYGISSNYPGYNPVISSEYLGGALQAPPVTLSIPGTYQFNSYFNLGGCIVSGKTKLNTPAQGCPNYESVWMYHNYNFPVMSQSSPATIVTVENPFVCAMTATNGAYNPPNPAPGSTVSFSFDLNNPGNRPLVISNGGITLSPGSIFQNLVINNGYPITVPQGGSVQITGTVLIPSGTASGTYPLNLNVNSQTSSADCSGSVKNCNVGPAFIVNINVGSADKPNYVIPSIAMDSLLYTSESFVSRVTTSNIGAIGTAITSQTNATFPSSPQVNLNVPGLGVGASNVQPAGFTCPSSAGVYNEVAYADSLGQITESNEGDNSRTLPITCNARPDRCTLEFVGHGSTFFVNDSAPVRASCYAGASATLCPNFTWTQNAVGGSMNPTFTSRAINPQSALTLLNAQEDTRRAVIANSAEPAIPLTCAVLFNITIGTPEAISCSLSSLAGPDYQAGATDVFTATCYDETNSVTRCPGMGWSTTIVSTPASYMQPDYTPQQYGPSSTLHIASTAQPQNKQVTATATSFSCSKAANVKTGFGNMTLRCDFDRYPAVFYPGESGNARAWCQSNAGAACPQLTWSTNIVGGSLQHSSTPGQPASPVLNLFSVAPDAPVPQTGGVTVSCANPLDCTATCTAALNVSPIPNRLDCFLNHSNTGTGNVFTTNDWAYVNGKCYNVTGSFSIPAACPQLSWYSRQYFPKPKPITGSNFDPNPTNQSYDPITNFSITDGIAGERGYIDANSMSPIVPGLKCSAVLNLSVVTSIGPNYQIIKLTPSNVLPKIGETVHISIWTQNNGNQNATVISTTLTVVAPADCLPDNHKVRALNIGDIDKREDYLCTCTTPGRHKIIATADANNNIVESDEADNTASAVFYCADSYALACYDYV